MTSTTPSSGTASTNGHGSGRPAPPQAGSDQAGSDQAVSVQAGSDQAGSDQAAVRFTEQMAGPFTLGVTDPRKAADVARPLGHQLLFRLTISTGPMDRFLQDPIQSGTAQGYVHSDVMGGTMPVEHGWFNLFVPQGRTADRRMLYRLWFTDAGGTPLTLVGYKEVHNYPGFDIWRDTTTLYTQVLSGHVPPGHEVAEDHVRGAGIIRITPAAFARQLTTFRTSGPHGSRALAAFCRLFARELWNVFGAPLVRLPVRRRSS